MPPVIPALKSRLRGLRRSIEPAPDRPAWVQVEINNTCNLNCVMCPRESLRRPPRLMSLEEFSDIAAKCAAAGVRKVRLFLMGEPLLHPRLLAIVHAARSAGIPQVTINTNAALVTAELSKELLRSGLTEVVFSLDGATRETYEAIRRGASYDEVTGAVEEMCRLAHQTSGPRPKLIVQTMVMAGVQARDATAQTPVAADTTEEIGPFVTRWRKLADQVDVQVVREYQGVDGVTPVPRRLPGDDLRPCPALWEYMVILADGTLSPCCVDINGDMSPGHVSDIPDLHDFWRRSPRLSALRRQHCALDFRDLPLCRDCDFINVGLLKRKERAAAAQP